MTSRNGVRINRRPYVHVDSQTVRDTAMSYRALGILTYLLDQSEDWQVKSEQLSKGEGREGRDAVRKALHELARRGHYRLERRRFRNGQNAMGTAISEFRVEQWAKDYVTFGENLTVPVVEQEDGSFQVHYPDGSFGTDGFTTEAAGAEPDLDDELEEETPAEEPETPASPAPKPSQVAKPAAAQKAAEKALLDADAEEVAKWWWADAEKRYGPYVGDKRGYLGMRKQVRNALEKGYTKNQCGKALIRAAKHWPSAQQWQDALGIVANHIQPRNAGDRVPYNDAATWGGPGDSTSIIPGATNGPPPSTPADDDHDDATFGIVERP
ncbi:hypothetical protein [Streptomyces stelliscabiei]|uniref:hypothetical protein n=1 Tax=Streptomyces stelliscabiei TaxID=146820 RepID=UPI00299FDEA3|nr:hypothetical protein [Streptomyces stelliscabiei]MDX2557721.1 hypothetical protein [Streptomyces stelliscabiei]MDX2617427.1 hypothetical protein [Streptomyces stelliscabiei]MDX2641586.1 hypothetical protein [Streptomyces stelliscabiei]MDX2667539.1 hypothetical protein [Streptomyces stelliscabiei]MDX2715853.1 hypothetical protein [Streptomyces stelliscabiei]